jgi:ER membrane protein complex subunit 8/9
MDILVSKLAYCKILLHLAKYPHLACNGVLLSRKQNSSTTTTTNEYIDAIPLFHSGLGLSSNIEIALFQIDAFCEQNDLEISGYYHANENIHDNQ